MKSAVRFVKDIEMVHAVVDTIALKTFQLFGCMFFFLVGSSIYDYLYNNILIFYYYANLQ